MSARTIALDLTLNGTVECNDAVSTTALLTTVGRAITRTAKTAAYTITGADYLVGCDTTSAAFTITLPEASTVANQVFYVVDEAGTANANNITIARSGSDTINGDTSVLVNTSYTSLTLYSDGGTGYHII
jgi:hypothetical protein